MSRRGTIVAERVWKRFRADRQRMLLRDQVDRAWSKLRGNGDRGWRWALRDVTLRAEPGESIGLVGVNGSGKSTLLKTLARVMYPYAGRVEVGGRVGALIEVRSGIHPDLTGRENTYLYGSILGLRRKQVARRFDDIVGFAQLEDAIDRQVKFYSSGMQMRLGFAIAAFLEPDVLLVDEALAVGDTAFQQRCLDRMHHQLSQGTTLVFVSHDLAAVEATCSRGLWLREGMVAADGPAREVLGQYRRSIEQVAGTEDPLSGVVRILKSEVETVGGHVARTQDPVEVRLVVESADPHPATIYVGFSEGPPTPIFTLNRDVPLRTGETEVRCRIPRLPLPRGRFYIWIGIYDPRHQELLLWHPREEIEVTGPDVFPPPGIVRMAPVHVDAEWDVVSR
jgi:ABC-type polysaccharide/polyol phosphate transport system ATPase subunit